MKKLVFSLSIALLLAACVSTQPADETKPADTTVTPPQPKASFMTEPSTVTAKVGETFTVNAVLTVENGRADSVDMTLFYNPEVLEVVDSIAEEDDVQIQTGKLFGGSYIVNYVEPNEGIIEVSAGSIKADDFFQGSDVYATITFKALAPTEKDAIYFDFAPSAEMNTLDTDVMLEEKSIDILEETRGTTVVITE
jgi:hypothetical protein